VLEEKADLLHAICDRITVAGPVIVGVRLTQAAYAHGFALALPKRLQWRARQVLGAGFRPTRSRSRAGMSGWRRLGWRREGPNVGWSTLRCARNGPRGQCRGCGGDGRFREGGCAPTWPLAFDDEAPPGERQVESERDDHGPARVDFGTAVA
jgi:hypothetical protein